jgi:hypothetical protein
VDDFFDDVNGRLFKFSAALTWAFFLVKSFLIPVKIAFGK